MPIEWGALAAAIVLLVLFLVLARAYVAFRDAGFTGFEALLVLVAAPLSQGVNLAIGGRGNVLLAVNVAGLLVPLVVSAKLVLEGRVPRVRTALAVAIVSAVVYKNSWLVPAEGVRLNVVVPIALAAGLGLLAAIPRFERAPLVAYVAGALGTLVGADLLRLPEILAMQPAEPTAASIGGAGTLDAIFLVALLAVALQLLLFGVFGRRSKARSRG